MYNLYEDIQQSPQFKKIQVGDLLLAEYTCEPGSLRSKLWSESNYFTFVVNGKLELITLKGRYLLEAGKAFFVRKGSCIFQLFEDQTYCELIIFATDEMIKSVLDRHQLPLHKDANVSQVDLVVPLAQNTVLSSYYQSLLTYFTHSKLPSKALLEVKFTELMLILLTSQPNPTLHQCFYEIGLFGKISISTVMEQNYCSDLSLTDFAKLCARSLSTFRRDFVQLYGVPPGRWLKEKRLQRSKQQLINSNKKLEEICFECGFSNRSHFSRLFKERFGQSPQSFRKQAAISQ